VVGVLQNTYNGVQVWEDGESESQPVIGWIRVPNLPQTKDVPNSIWFLMARKL
jgi:hypothetical protein